MRSSHCESYCAPPLCYLPCLPKSKHDASGDAVAASPSPAGVAAVPEDRQSEVQKVEEAVAGDDEEDSKEMVVEFVPKSSLKKVNCVDSKNVVKGNVKWLDLLGKDLTEVKEFEPSESGDSDDEDGKLCACVIQ